MPRPFGGYKDETISSLQPETVTADPSFIAMGVLLFSTGFTLSRIPDQDDHQVYLPLVSLAPPDVYGQFLNSIGGKDNLFYIADPLAFLGRGHQLVILDVSEPANPVYLTEVQLPSAPTFMVVQDGYGYITLGNAGMAILDIRQPAQASLLSRLPLGGISHHVLLSAGLAYVSSSQALYVVDISQAEFPRLLGSTTLDANYSQFHESLLLVKTMAGFDLIDISNPVAPVIIGIYENYWTLNIVAVEGDFVYMHGFGCGMLGCDDYLDIIDISDPSHPVYANMFQTWNSVGSIFFKADIAYISDGSDIIIAQVKPGGVLEELSRYQAETGGGMFLLEGNRLYLNAANSLEILDISHADKPKQIELYTDPAYANETLQSALPYIYYRASSTASPNGPKSLLVLDASDPEDVERTSSTPFSSFNMQPGFNAEHIYLDDAHMAVTTPTGDSIGYFPVVSLKVFDLEHPSAPVEIADYLPNGGVWFEGLAGSVQISGSIGYIMTLWRDLEIVDLSSSGVPQLLSTVLANARLVSVDGNYAYIVDEVAVNDNKSLHLLTLDVSNPYTPSLQSDFVVAPGFTAYHYAFDTSDGIAYFAFPGTMRLIDVSNPASPANLSAIPIDSENSPSAIDVSGELALLGVDNRLEIIDVSEPLTPTWLADFDTGGYITSIQINDQVVYLANETGVYTLDIRDPAQPRLIQHYPGYASSVKTLPGYPVYISRGQDGVEIYQHYPPAIPRE